ncbi:MAG: HIT family protein [Candidatus Dormibacteria bacterium]
METLWAPWRMAYVERVQSPEAQATCLFCDAAGSGGGSGDLVVHRSELALAMLNRFPYNPGHLLIAPKTHGGDLSVLKEGELLAVARELRLASRVLQAELGCEGINGGWNQGRAAGAGIEDHLHFHLVPRWSGDTNFMPVLADVKVVPEHLEATARKLREAFRRPREQI